MPADKHDPPTNSSPSGGCGAHQGEGGGQTAQRAGADGAEQDLHPKDSSIPPPQGEESEPQGTDGRGQDHADSDSQLLSPRPKSGSIPPPEGEVSAPQGADGGGQTLNSRDPGHVPDERETDTGLPSALLLGEDHTELAEVAIREITPYLAIGISRGRFAKGYAYVDPNEDAVYAATDGTTTVLAVADGHHGFDAARAAISAIADTAIGAMDAPLEAAVRWLAGAAIGAVRGSVPPLSPPRNTSRTAVTVASVRGNAVAAATIGDTAGFVVTRRRSKRLGTDTEFLSAETDPNVIEITKAKLSDRTAMILATDGFLDFAAQPKATLRTVPQLAALDAAELLISESFSGGAGDNIAVAVYRHS